MRQCWRFLLQVTSSLHHFLSCDLQVAYHGAPEKAYEVFVSALRDRYLEQGLLIPSLGDHNPAG